MTPIGALSLSHQPVTASDLPGRRGFYPEPPPSIVHARRGRLGAELESLFDCGGRTSNPPGYPQARACRQWPASFPDRSPIRLVVAGESSLDTRGTFPPEGRKRLEP